MYIWFFSSTNNYITRRLIISMEYSATSKINQKWYYCTLISFLCFIFICLYHDDTHQQIITIVNSLQSINSSNYNHQFLPKSNNTVMVFKLNASFAFTSISNISNFSSMSFSTTTSPTSINNNTIVSSNTIMSNWNVNIFKEEKCDVFDGEWILDSKSYPIYHLNQCPFLSDQVSCQKNGRPDSNYEHWRWQPRHCDIPRFNGTHMLERMRGKRIAIIGDSLNRNQWESLACLLYSSVKPWRAVVDARKANKLLRALDYDFSLEFYWSPFLVQVEQSKRGSKVLQLDKLADTEKYQNADILVFNTGHWWTHRGRSKTWNYYKHHRKLVKEMEGNSAFETAMKTWAFWIENFVNSTKTRVFFRSISPEHKIENLHWCYNQTQPIINETYKQSFPASMVSIVEETMKNMKVPVKYLNITRLSEYRRDAHTSVYTVRQGKLLTESERKQPDLYADCSHWCLPGLPDTWNSLLYASIIGDLL